MRRLVAHTAILGILLASLGASARAEPSSEPEPIGAVRSLPAQPGPHWFWLTDLILHRTALFDADSGDMLGSISAGTAGVGFIVSPLFSPDRKEIYVAESYYSRGVRGDRTDVVTVYDGRTLQPLHEISIPPKRAEYFPGNAPNALSDDGRFMAVFNLTPMTSLSIVDVRERRFVGEVQTPGCSLVYTAGPRRFFMLCANGGALVVTLDDQGGEQSVVRTPPFFDPNNDPVTEKAVRRGNEWLFVSFEGQIHPVDVSGPELRFGEKWSLVDDADRAAQWRVGGGQHLAVHAGSGRLYTLMHQGAKDTHKQPGTEVWVYDLSARKRVQRIPTMNPLLSFVGQQMGLAQEGRTSGLTAWAMGKMLPHSGIERIAVTQDDKPVLVVGSALPPTVTVHDAMTGAVVREISEPGIAGTLFYAP
jgi:methylamine dehydrogenase heavy chain